MRSKNLILHAKHRLPIYGHQIHLYVSHDPVITFNRVCKLWNCDPEKGKDSGFRAMTVRDDDGVFGIFFSKSDLIESSIAHEVKHMTDDIMEYIGADCNKCKREPACYLTGYLAAWVKRVLRRHGLKHSLT